VGSHLKKLAELCILILFALILDGSLTYDLFDFSTQPFAKALGMIIFLLVLGGIVWAENTTKSGDKSTPE